VIVDDDGEVVRRQAVFTRWIDDVSERSATREDRRLPGVAPEPRGAANPLPADAESAGIRPFVTTKKEGTGLGLWISRTLLERYGGDIRTRNRTDGVIGALLTVVLPADTQASGLPQTA